MLTIKEKKDILKKAVEESLSGVFSVFMWKQLEENPAVFILTGKINENVERKAYLAGCHDTWNNEIYIEYNPTEDIVGICLTDRPIQERFKDDLLNIFEKYRPYNMQLSFNDKLIPLISRKEVVKPNDFNDFFLGFQKAYAEFYPLFYMVSVCAKKWYDGFQIKCSYCVDGVYY